LNEAAWLVVIGFAGACSFGLRKQLRWHRVHSALIPDLDQAHYFATELAA
jgi:hypothetical protein